MTTPDKNTKAPVRPKTKRVDALAEWRSRLTGSVSALLLFELVSGLLIYAAPFTEYTQFNALLHSLIGVAMLVPLVWYVVRHWKVRKKGNLSHYQLLGYVALAVLAICVFSGLLLTWQGLVGPRIDYGWSLAHLVTGVVVAIVIVIHLATVAIRKQKADPELLVARRRFYAVTMGGCVLLMLAAVLWAAAYREPPLTAAFPDDYNWQFGEDRPFAPSLARLDYSAYEQELDDEVAAILGGQARLQTVADDGGTEQRGLLTQLKQHLGGLDLSDEQRGRIDTAMMYTATRMKQSGASAVNALAGSERCGTSGCHDQIYEEWLPSAHRYSALDDMFQRVQTLMVEETSPEHTRYCAGCHDPISLFSGAKNAGNITLSAEGSHEGTSCLVCHSIVQADVQGNGDYTIEPQKRYVYELSDGVLASLASDYLIRTYPEHHTRSYSRSLYKTPEFCAACHKQYVDKEVNTDIGKVQGQNQYDSWKNSRWYVEGDPEQSIECRECHMPMVDSSDPASGDPTDYNRNRDDGKHRSHRTLASNQYIPLLHKLEGAEKHVELTEQWLRGEIEIPEISDKWSEGPVVAMEIVAPPEVSPGEDIRLQVVLTNNKTGHDFPTGPLDMIESWVEIKVTDDDGNVLYSGGAADEDGQVRDLPVLFKADGFDREGKLIDRHNLWDLVGASYKRTLYPGMTDSVEAEFVCPSMGRGRVAQSAGRIQPGQRIDDYAIPAAELSAGTLNVTASLWYRKANPEFLDRIYGVDANVRAPLTQLSSVQTTIRVMHAAASAE
ncbi:MAG: multiheme c-type cytochrome [Gammaproteobacteria bacterium]|nr:multiheme c-type cytochrome [Gammaproteobacteria bacterium]